MSSTTADTKPLKQPIVRDLTADDPEPEVTEIESLCMNCQENGKTRLLLTKIPFYKEIVIMSFSCEKCGYENNEIQPSGKIAEHGIRFTLTVKSVEDLNRQVVKSDYTSIKIVELDFEIPSQSQKGEVTTVEGIIDRAITGLEQDQEVRRLQHPDVAAKIDEFIEKMKKLKDVEEPFTLILEDISGNSFIANPDAPLKDPNCVIHHFKRTKEQDHILGIYTREEVGENDGILHPIEEGQFTYEDLQGEVLHLPTNCCNCGSPCETNMKLTNIPHFKEVVIMATICDVCGTKTNEVKSGGGIEEKGIRIEVIVSEPGDFSRDVLKSETCSLTIPELQLEVGPLALGGRFTTVEGVITSMKDQLKSSGLMLGDSQDPETRARLEKFLSLLDEVLENKRKVTLVLDDPAGNSYVQSMRDDDQPDERLKIIRYERTDAQNDELGLKDMKTENYETNETEEPVEIAEEATEATR